MALKLFGFTHQLLELSMRVRSARHELLSANIANADTPGYRPKDLDFTSVMRSALDERDAKPAGSEARFDDDRVKRKDSLGAIDIQSMVYEPEFPNNRHGEDRLDGNGVSIDRQMALMSENSLAYEASLTLLSRALAGLRYAIGEGRR
jgi:flagellar basal-body rod protein FlgB